MKWSKKICVQYIQEMRSPIEEMARQTPGNGQSLFARLRRTVEIARNNAGGAKAQ